VINRSIWVAIALAGAVVCARGQWLNQRVPGTPRTHDGKPNLSAPVPRASNGEPDLSGVWQAESATGADLARLAPGGGGGALSVPGEGVPSKYFINVLADFKPEESPLRPAAAAVFQQHAATFSKDFPTARCLPAGVPAGGLLPIPYKIIQTPGVIVMLYEADTTFRQIFTDGRKQPPDPQPAWLGYSIGKWEGDWMVVDTIGFNDQSWLDASGHPHSEALHTVERFHRSDFGRMEVQVTIDDPKTFTKPFTFQFNQRLIPDTDLMETYCSENEKDAGHLAAAK
jgi:hypothetical protein